ncbi:oxetanocin [Thermococcus chitonophagus]|uniref:5'-deoxynucleotidase n=1 Tax=Thermococcus chitonophagus TaxID=54262 RepID=A0A160VSA0_9EURY|nr:HD family hydrolase [Thermococcus chitonophagus]ASJ17322.1 oxetanocin [Thermococcus chitonophagus]CUX77953.1 Nucleotidase YfbR, HD superfamily [Thermococcus chitonophagus]
MLEKIKMVMRLKVLPRMGWLLKGVPNPESIADHSYMVAFITLLLAEDLKKKGVRIDVEKALKMAILHDVAEAVVTDLPLPAQRYLEKESAELSAFNDLLPEFYSIFNEYREGSSLEAQLVKFADKVEMLVQAHMYELSGNRNLGEFWKSLEDLERMEIAKYFADLLSELRRLKS